MTPRDLTGDGVGGGLGSRARRRSFVSGMATGAALLLTGAALGGFRPGVGDGEFDVVTARQVVIVDQDGTPIVRLGESMRGDGSIFTYNASGTQLVAIGVTPMGDGAVGTFSAKGQALTALSATPSSEGIVQVFDARGRKASTMPALYGPDGAPLDPETLRPLND